jgi:hypothetical protein
MRFPTPSCIRRTIEASGVAAVRGSEAFRAAAAGIRDGIDARGAVEK